MSSSPKTARGSGIHYAALQTSYIGTGDLTGAAEIPSADTITSWVFLTGVGCARNGEGLARCRFRRFYNRRRPFHP